MRLENGCSEKGRTPPEELPMGSGRDHPGPALYARVFFIAYLVFATGYIWPYVYRSIETRPVLSAPCSYFMCL